MKKKRRAFVFLMLVPAVMLGAMIAFSGSRQDTDKEILAYIVDSRSKGIDFYWKDDSGHVLGSLQNLKTFVEGKGLNLLFATNGGMFTQNREPKGLFIQEHKLLTPLDTGSGEGNFYLKPNGVFYITSGNIPVICRTGDFPGEDGIRYATQSGPMLLADGNIHPAFKEGSSNKNIRNGVGILPDNRLIFAMSVKEINFYDFASYFKKQGCKNALYLDGFVSRSYLPEKNWKQTDGDFAVIIGVTQKTHRK